MKFNDQGIIISQKKYGENSLIIKVFCQNHGLYSAFIKSAKSAKNRSIFQIGNLIAFEYRARNEDNLGQFYNVDLIKSYCSSILFEPYKLNCVNSLFAIITQSFLERESHQILFGEIDNFLQNLTNQINLELILSDYVKLELEILKTLGYGLDLERCAVSLVEQNLNFVSPKSGRAVCDEVANPYKSKLLKLPKFLIDNNAQISKEDLKNALDLSGFFLQKFIFNDDSKLLYRLRLYDF